MKYLPPSDAWPHGNRLTDVEGRTFEDTVDDGIVLFLSDEPVAMPMRVDLYDAESHVVGTDEWGFVHE